jgi:hypothetical protein
MNDGIRYQMVDNNGQPTTMTSWKRPIVYYRDSIGYGAIRIWVWMTPNQLEITFPTMSSLYYPEAFSHTPLNPDGFITQSRATSTMSLGTYASDGTNTTHPPFINYACQDKRWTVGFISADDDNKKVRISVLCD